MPAHPAHQAVSLRVAFQGELGAYSEEAVRRFFGAAADPVARRDFRSVGEAVLGGEADFGLLPIENSLAGSVEASYDVLGAMELVAVGEVISPIHHLVLGLPGARSRGPPSSRGPTASSWSSTAARRNRRPARPSPRRGGTRPEPAGGGKLPPLGRVDPSTPRTNTMLRHLLAALALLAAAPALAQPAAGTEGDFVLRRFRFTDGSVLPELRIHYTTLGRPRRDAAGKVRNAVLILHGTTGSGRNFLGPGFAGELFGPGQPLDTASHYVILPDGIGTGKSSKPSDGLRARFPRYGYEDMVTAQYRLVTEGLRVNHLLLVMGTSMGGMQTWMWGERYPGFMDGLVPLASVPTQIAGRNRMMRKMISDAIRTDPDWRGGDYTAPPRGLYGALEMLFMMTSSPLTLQRAAPTRDSADAYISSWMRARMAATDANDFLYQFEASRDYDPSPHLERIRTPLLAINSADDLVNPPELGLMERLMPRVRHGRYVLIPTSERTRGHGTHSLPALWKEHLVELLRRIGRREEPQLHGSHRDTEAQSELLVLSSVPPCLCVR
jgi:homoserine O-acetyltransferase